MKKNGFTLIEILISLAIIAALAGISIPAIYSNVVKIEQASTVESAMNGLRQFFVDARAKSIIKEIKYELSINSNSLTFTGSAATDSIYYTLPTGVRTQLTLATDTTTGPLSYLLGMFLEEKDDYYEIEDNYRLLVKVKDTPTVLG
ncbi:MAG: prepilin-type N-terminal cleavage/methylation domain-containing protein, partial [Thermotogota bacterium]|nr:prepilin-type N-terminal cleavage/methylation domain-containing protein [Thermotogota bacterium]